MSGDERIYKFFTVWELPIEPGRKTPRYAICNNRSGELLGFIVCYAPWRQFCLRQEPFADIMWSGGCLGDIQDAIKWAERRRKEVADEAPGND